MGRIALSLQHRWARAVADELTAKHHEIVGIDERPDVVVTNGEGEPPIGVPVVSWESLEQVVTEVDAILALVGTSPALLAVRDQIAKVARLPQPVLVTGESGTGKELVATAIHHLSGRKGQIMRVNCGAIPKDLIESELFGHERGSFSGAVQQTDGKFRSADKGTIFLDEVGDLPLPQQVKLLRVLEDGLVVRLGGTQPTKVDVRVVAATNKPLPTMIASEAFRADLYYRLTKGWTLYLPALRDRPEDIAPIARAYLDRCHPGVCLSDQGATALVSRRWDGNVREMEGTLNRAALMAHRGTILARHISPDPPEERRMVPSRPHQLVYSPPAPVSAEIPRAVPKKLTRWLGPGEPERTWLDQNAPWGGPKTKERSFRGSNKVKLNWHGPPVLAAAALVERLPAGGADDEDRRRIASWWSGLGKDPQPKKVAELLDLWSLTRAQPITPSGSSIPLYYDQAWSAHRDGLVALQVGTDTPHDPPPLPSATPSAPVGHSPGGAPMLEFPDLARQVALVARSLRLIEIRAPLLATHLVPALRSVAKTLGGRLLEVDFRRIPKEDPLAWLRRRLDHSGDWEDLPRLGSTLLLTELGADRSLLDEVRRLLLVVADDRPTWRVFLAGSVPYHHLAQVHAFPAGSEFGFAAIEAEPNLPGFVAGLGAGRSEDVISEAHHLANQHVLLAREFLTTSGDPHDAVAQARADLTVGLLKVLPECCGKAITASPRPTTGGCAEALEMSRVLVRGRLSWESR